jgi:1,4-alpha-glucan branching enzyme
MCVVVAANMTPVPRHGYRVGLPTEGRWHEVLTTDDARYGGSGVTNPDPPVDPSTPWQGQVASTVLTLPPLGATFLAVR